MNVPRTALCLECRTALAPGETCDAHPRLKPADLAQTAGRNRAVDAVWGPPHLRARQAAKVGAAGGTAGGAAEGCAAGCEGCGEIGSFEIGGEAAIAMLVIIIAAIGAIILYYLIKYIVHAVRQHRDRPRPAGSRWKPKSPSRVLRGTIQAVAASVTAPLSKASCAAWGLLVAHDRTTNGPIMLRDGETAGLTLALEDGRVVTIPAGRVRVEGDGEKQPVDVSYLGRVDPSYSTVDDHPVFPSTTAREVRLAVGDSVTITTGLSERFNADAPAGYREAPQMMLVVDGVPTLVRD